MKKYPGAFKEKVCITLSSKDIASKKPAYIVVRKVFLYTILLFFFSVVGVGAYAGITAYLSMNELKDSVVSLYSLVQENKDALAKAQAQNEEALLAMAQVTLSDTLPAISGDELAAEDTADSLFSDPWLTVESAPVVESTQYESGSINGHVELIDWFDGGSDIYARHSEATVIDVSTGLSFRVQRIGGTYHADTEPLSKEDTQILKQIIGGKWTWDRRAIWVKVGDRYIAASMNSMPHNYQSGTNNAFSGHFCIHLFRSRIHESGKQCPIHQAAVMEAFASAEKLEEYLKTNDY